MIVARLFVGLGNTGIKYNKPSELGIDKDRGTVLEDGGVLRGLGTHFASAADKARYDDLVKQSNKVRVAFAEQFMKLGLWDSTFILSRKGEAAEFAAKVRKDLEISDSVLIDILEMELSNAGEGLSDRHIAEWAESVKDQLKRVQLGRKKEIASGGLDALEKLADCPALSDETAGALRQLVNKARLGQVPKDEFQRSIAIMDVKLDTTVLSGPKRMVPENI